MAIVIIRSDLLADDKMAGDNISARIIFILLSAPLLVNAVSPVEHTEFTSQFAELRKEFQSKIDYLFNVIQEKDGVHSTEIAKLQRQIDALQEECGDRKLHQDSQWSESDRNTTLRNPDDDTASPTTIRGRPDRQNDVPPESRDRRFSISFQRQVRVVPDNRRNVAFYSYLQKPLTNPAANQPIIFNHMLTNLGNMYNVNTGIFQCGVPGVYVLNFHILCLPGHDINTSMVKNGTPIGYAYASGQGGGYDHGGNTVIVELAVGDQVWVRPYANQNQATLNSYYTSFSGFLLYPYEQY